MKYGLDISPAGPWGDPRQIAELAALAESCGWDGVFCEDYLVFPGGVETYDPWITLALVPRERALRWDGACLYGVCRRRRGETSARRTSTVCGSRLASGVVTTASSSPSAGESAETMSTSSAPMCARSSLRVRTGGTSMCRRD